MSDNRPLTKDEIEILRSQGCQAENWDQIQVAHNFDSSRVWRCYFGGKIKLPAFSGKVKDPWGGEKPAGIYDCAVFDCEIGEGTRLSHVRTLRGYRLGEAVLIENVGSLCAALTQPSETVSGLR